MKKGTVFDAIVSELMRDAGSSEILAESMGFDPGKVSRIPLRYRIIALGFVRHYSLEELNNKLDDMGCARLYARSLWEASLIFAFLHRFSYDEWKKLQEICSDFREKQGLEDPYFQSSSISLKELSAYLADNSEESYGFATKHLTRLVEKRLENADPEEAAFRDFLRSNMEAFTPVREKTRYYFCKYMYYMINARCNRYVEATLASDAEDAFADLVVLKGISGLKRKKMTTEEIRAFLSETDLSCGGIFDAFNYFYFEYVSLDWMQVLLEYYGNANLLPPSAKAALAASLRRYDPAVYSEKDDKKVIETMTAFLEEEERNQDEIYSLEGSSRGYQRNRSGENTLRKYIKGTLDIDRTTFICFLLFFSSDAKLEGTDRITEERLNHILLECGFPGLKEENEFDGFVRRYLTADDPVSCLMDEVTDYALMEENFYLYRVYQASTSYNDEFEKLISEEYNTKRK